MLGAILAHSTLVQASTETPSDMPTLDMLKWAFTQGGLVLVTLVVLWSYRKDFQGVLSKQQDQITVLTGLVKEATAAMQHAASASEELKNAVERLQSRL